MGSNQCSNSARPWAPMVEGITTRMAWTRSLELEQLRAKGLYFRDFVTNFPISSSYRLYADGSGGTTWASDGIQSTLLMIGQSYLSSIPSPLYTTTILTSTISATHGFQGNFIELLSTSDTGTTTVFSDGTISAHTVVVYGSNTLYNKGIISLYDIELKKQSDFFLANGQLIAKGTEASPFFITPDNLAFTVGNLGSKYVSTASLVSTTSNILSGLTAGALISSVEGIGSARYISTPALTSTVAWLIINGGALKSNDIISTTGGLGTAGYISSASLQSTVGQLLENPPDVLIANMTSTVRNLGRASYVSSTQLASSIATFFSYAVLPNLTSTTEGLGTASYISSASLTSTVASMDTRFLNLNTAISSIDGLGTASYISSQSLVSTVDSFFMRLVANSNVESTIQELGSLGYISTMDLTSSVFSLTQSLVQSVSTQSTVAGLGSLSYVSSTGLQSTVKGFYDTPGILFTSNTLSSVRGLGTATYILSPSIQSTVKSLLAQDVILTGDFYSTVVGLGNVYRSSLVSSTDGLVKTLVTVPWLESTVEGLGSASYLPSLSLQSTVGSLQTGYESIVFLQSTVEGIGTASYVSSLSLQSTVGGFFAKETLLRTDITSTVAGLGSAPYVSTSAIQSTVRDFLTNLPLNTGVTSSLTYLGQLGYVSTNSLTSTVGSLVRGYQTNDQVASTTTGLGTVSYVSTLSLLSTVTRIYNTYITSDGLQSTVTGMGRLYVSTASLNSTTSALVPGSIATDIFSTVGGLATAGYIFNTNLASTFEKVYFNSGGLFAPNITSTVEGLGTARYVSTVMLQSSVAGVLSQPVSVTRNNLTSTVGGLANIYLLAINSNVQNISSGALNVSTLGIGASSSNSAFALNAVSTNALISTPTNLLETTYGVSVMSYMFLTNGSDPNTYRPGLKYSLNGGITWADVNVVSGNPISNVIHIPIRPPGYNGKYFFYYTVNQSFNNYDVYYSLDGINWRQSSNVCGLNVVSQGYSFQWSIGISPVASYMFQYGTNYGIRYPATGNQTNIGWYFDNATDPTQVKPITNVTWARPALEAGNYIPIDGFAYNGIFHVLAGHVQGTNGGYSSNDSTYMVFISYDGYSWTQCNVGFPGDVPCTNTPVAIGQYVYLFSKGYPFCKRSINGVNWELIALTGGEYNINGGSPVYTTQIAHTVPTPTGYILNGIGSASDTSGFGAFFNNTRIPSTLNTGLSNIGFGRNLNLISFSNLPNRLQDGTWSAMTCVFQVGKDINRYIAYAPGFVNSGPGRAFCWYSTDGMNTWTSPLPIALTSICAVGGIVNSYDNRSYSLRTGNISFNAFEQFVKPLYSNTSNYITTKSYSNSAVSTVMNINDGLYIKNQQRGVGIGAQFGLNYFFPSTSASGKYPPNFFVNNFFSSPTAQTSTIGLDVDGSIVSLTTTNYLPSRTTWTAYSDERIKTNIQEADLSRCLEIVSSIPLYHYNYSSTFHTAYSVGDKSVLGYIANNVATCFPRAVREHTYNNDFGFAPLTLDTEQLDMATYGVTKYLISTIKQKNIEILSLDSCLSSLKSDLSTLTSYFKPQA